MHCVTTGQERTFLGLQVFLFLAIRINPKIKISDLTVLQIFKAPS